MGLQDSDKKANEKITNVLKDTKGIKPSERMEDCSKYKSIGSISPLTFEVVTIPPDIDATKL